MVHNAIVKHYVSKAMVEMNVFKRRHIQTRKKRHIQRWIVGEAIFVILRILYVNFCW